MHGWALVSQLHFPLHFLRLVVFLFFFVYAGLIFAESQRSNSNDQRVAGARVAGS